MSAWNYVVTAHKPTAVTHSLVGNFTGADETNLIIAKCTRIEIHLLSPQGLQPLLDVPIYGRIAVMMLLRPPSEKKDLLFICTERYKFCVLEYDAGKGEIQTRAMGDVSEKIGRPTDRGQIGIVDPQSRLVGLHLYDGALKVIPIDSKGQMKEAYNIRLEELNVLDLVFLFGCSTPTLAVLYQDNKECRHLAVYELTLKEKDLRMIWTQPNVDNGAGMLIPVPSPLGGVVVVGEQTIAYLDGTGFKAVNIKCAVTCAYCPVDPDGSRFLLSDNFGLMHLLVLQKDESHRVLRLKLEPLGITSAASSLSYLDSGVVFVGSCFGDSQLIKLSAQPSPSGSYVEVLETFTNLGPIVDLCVIDFEQQQQQVQQSQVQQDALVATAPGAAQKLATAPSAVGQLSSQGQNQGQGVVVTCSGAFKDGSLRIVRNGIGMNEQATIELPGIKGLFSLRSSSLSRFDSFLVVSFVGETRVLALREKGGDEGGMEGEGEEEEEEELEEAEIPGFYADKQTLYCGNVWGDRIVQVTSSEARLVSCATKQALNVWKTPAGHSINVATGNEIQILLATGGGNVVLLEISDFEFVQKAHVQLEFEVSCLNINPLLPPSVDQREGGAVGMDMDTFAPAARSARFAAVGMWTDMSVRVYSLPEFSLVEKVNLGGEIIPRDVLLCSMESSSYLFCALGDGHLFSFKIDPVSGALSETKKVSIGSQPITLRCFKSGGQSGSTTSSGGNNGATHVFAASDRPTVIHSTNRKLLFSTVNLKEVSVACPFNCAAFPDSLALAKADDLSIGSLDEIQKLHIRTLPLYEQPRRICHQPETHSLAFISIKHHALTVLKEANVGPSSSFLNPLQSGPFGMGGSSSLEFGFPPAAFEGPDGFSGESHFVRVLHDQSFDLMGSFQLDPFENGCSIASLSFAEDSNVYLVVGTAYALPEESEPTKGRILVFSLQQYIQLPLPPSSAPSSSLLTTSPSLSRLTLVCQREVKGSVYNLNAFQGKLLAGINNKVQLFRWVVRGGGEGGAVGGALGGARELQSECSHHGHVIALCVKVKGDFVVVGDLMKSFILLIYKPEEGTLEERARDYNSNWMTAVEILNDEIYLGSENALNLVTVKKNSEGATDEERGRLEVVGEYHLGEFVNVFRHGSLVMRLSESEWGGNIPTILFGTVNGMIGLIASIPQSLYHFLYKLQSAMNRVVKGVGGFNHEQWRSFCNERKTSDARNFIDGDLVETFLDLARDKMDEVSRLVGESAEEIAKKVEELSRLH